MQADYNSGYSSIPQIRTFMESAVVIPVVSEFANGVSRLRVSRNHPEKLESLRVSTQYCMRTLGRPELAAEMIEELLSRRLQQEMWYVSIKGGPTVILVKEDVFEQIPEQELVEFVHKEEVDLAIQRGEDVPVELLRYYRGKSSPQYKSQAM
jgi:hypothetical protein